MARKDFAQVQAPQIDKRGTGNMRSLLVAVGMLIVVGASFIGGFMLGETQGKATAEHDGKQHLLDEIDKQRNELSALKKKAKTQKPKPDQASTQVGDLTFYNTLPNQDVTPAPLDASQHKTNQANKITDTTRHELGPQVKQHEFTGTFKLQLGSYQRKEDAEGLKALLEKNGFQAVVEETMVPNLGLWFRVYTGPYSNPEMAEQVRSQVQAKMHITGLLLHDQ